MNYTHLTLEERYQIRDASHRGDSSRRIGKALQACAMSRREKTERAKMVRAPISARSLTDARVSAASSAKSITVTRGRLHGGSK